MAASQELLSSMELISCVCMAKHTLTSLEIAY
jgi:hypothetical protein